MTLGTFERRVARSFAAGLFPARDFAGAPAGAGAGDLPDGADVGFDTLLEELLDRAPARMRIGTRLALWAFAVAPLLLLGRFRLATGLAPADLDRYVVKVLGHSLYFVRAIGLMLKAFAAMAYFRDRRVQAALGLKGA